MDSKEYEYEIKHVVLPKIKKVIFKCQNCKTMFVTHRSYFNGAYINEVCPCCAKTMGKTEQISLAEYNLIRWFRGDFRKTENDKVKEIENFIAENGGENFSKIRIITCSCCKYGKKKDENSYECYYPKGKHGYCNPKDFYCKDAVDKSVKTEDEHTYTRTYNYG